MEFDKKEFSYQHTHFVWGVIVSYIFYKLKFNYYYLIGFFCGLGLEVYQYYFNDNNQLFICDRIMDISFWTLGGMFLYYYINKIGENNAKN